MTLESYLKHMEAYKIDGESVDKSRLDYHIPMLKQMDQISNSSVALFDMSLLRYVYITEKFRFLIGLDRDSALEEGMNYFFQYMNPDDKEMFFHTSLSAFDYLRGKKEEEKKLYKTSQDFRIQRGDGLPVRLVQQIIALELNRQGQIWLVLIVTDKSPINDPELPGQRYMEHISSGNRVLFGNEQPCSKSPITKRELEILGLISRGFSSRNVAEYLSLSVATVNNHRQHILEKMNVTNTAEAIAYSKNLGILH